MFDLNYLAVVVAAIAMFVVSTGYYVVFGKQMAALHPAYAGDTRPKPWQIAVELVRNLVLALVIALLADAIGIRGWDGALQVALLLWVGFPLVLWSGAVMWEKVPLRLAAIHAGDWLLKLLLATVVIGLWR